MKKVKLVISDLHLGNGRFLPDGSLNPLEDFSADDKLIELIDTYASQKDSDVELIFNGDFFNMIQLMPEEQHHGIQTAKAAIAKIQAIVAGHAGIFEALLRFNGPEHRRILFLMGNHDPGLLWKGVQDFLRMRIQGEVVFAEDAYCFDGVHIEHGHQREPIHRLDHNRYFLTRGFPEPVLNLPWGTFFVKDFLYKIKRRRPYVDKVKPFGTYLRWCLYNDFWFGLATLIRYFCFILFSRFSRLPLKRRGAFHGLLAVWRLSRSPTLEDAAERIFKEKEPRIVILGHTHIPFFKNFGKDRQYLNPGTWNDVTNLDIPHLGHSRRMIYVLIEYREGKPQARLLEWHGYRNLFDEFQPA